MSIVRAALQRFASARAILPAPFRSSSSTLRPNRSCSSRLSPADNPRVPAFVAQEHLLTDGRLNEAASLALLAGFPELGGVWRARFDSTTFPGRVRATVSFTLPPTVGVRASRLLDVRSLTLGNWLQRLRQLLVVCVEAIYRELEEGLAAHPDGRAAETLVRGSRLADTVPGLIQALQSRREQLLAPGNDPLASLDSRRGGVNLVAEIEADARAELLLAYALGPAYRQLQRNGYLDVPSRLFPGRIYRVRRGLRVQVLDGGRCMAELCLEPGIKVPDADDLLMKTVWLQANERYVLRTANHFPASRLLV